MRILYTLTDELFCARLPQDFRARRVEMEEEEGMARCSCYEFIELRQDFSKKTSLVAEIWLH